MAEQCGEKPALTAGSARGGGATALLLACGEPPVVQRWGRWQNGKSMETYLQELQAATMMADLQPEVRERVVIAADLLPLLWPVAVSNLRHKIPPEAWQFWRALPEAQAAGSKRRS